MVRASVFIVLWIVLTGYSLVRADPVVAGDIEWTNCAAMDFAPDDLDADVVCGWLTVQETASPDARTLRLAFVQVPALDPKAKLSPILYLHGGPGIAALDVLPRALKGKSWPLFRRTHDLVFLDYRGVGRSTPAVCPVFGQAMETLSRENPDPQSATARRVDAASACRVELLAKGGDPSAYGADAIAQDVETLRRALGYPHWAVFATSYGVFPAVELMRRWPETITGVIFDSAFPPDSPNRFQQLGATAEAFAALQARCDAEPACAARYPDIRAAAGRVAARLEIDPFSYGDRSVTGEAFNEAVWTMLVDGFTAPFLPEMVRRLEAGDPDLMRRFIETFGRSDVFGGYAHATAWLANCHDLWTSPTAPTVGLAMAEHPDLALGEQADAQDRVCAAFGAGSLPSNFFRPISSDLPTLIFFGEFDPATPRSDALAAQAGLSRALLVDVPGSSHAPFYTDDCTRQIGATFLASPAVAPDLSCLASRAPVRLHDPEAFDAFVETLSP